MPNILIKTKDPSIIPMLYRNRKPGYELVPVALDSSINMLLKCSEVHAVIIDSDLTNPHEVQQIKNNMDDAMFPVILLSMNNVMNNQEAGMWLGCGVSDIFHLPMPVPLMAKRLGAQIQLYCVTQSLHGQVTDKLTGLHNRHAFYHFAKKNDRMFY